MPRENLDSAKILKIAKLTFDTDKPTAEQIKYVMTFNVPNRDMSKASGHRPWQVGIINDQHPNKVVIKSRQLGLNLAPVQ